MLVRSTIFFACLLLLSTAEARMYQWQDPDSGTTHFSGKPPAWYRSGTGPRVIVFEQGRIIDDTRIRLSDDTDDELRMQAIVRAEEDRERARQKALAAEEMRAKLGPDAEIPVPALDGPPDTAAAPALPELPAPAVSEAPLPTTDMTEESMRALIMQWEQLRTEEVR